MKPVQLLLPSIPFKGTTTLPLPSAGYMRLVQIVGDKKKGITAIFPVSKSTWWAGVKSGKYPQPVSEAVGPMFSMASIGHPNTS